MEIPNGKLQEICGQANAQRNGGSAELRHRAEPAGAPPRCGRRQCIRNTNLDDEWIVGIGHARARIAAEIPTRCRTEEFGWRSAYDCAEIMEQIRLIGKAAGICDISPVQAAFPRGDNLFVPRQSRILFGAGPVNGAEAARQVPLADTQ
jgi:hypothetical protein